jgi:hypothetical protein
MADGGFRAVTRKNLVVITKLHNLFKERVHQIIIISAGKVCSPDTACK